MYSSTYRFTLDLHSTVSQISLPVTIGDTNRAFNIRLADGGLPYTIEDGCVAMITIKRPGGTALAEFCPVERNTLISYNFSQNSNTAAEEGIHTCEIILYDSKGDILASPWFTMIVTGRAAKKDDIPISDENRTFIDGIVTEELERREAELAREKAEKGDNLDGLGGRMYAETQRKVSETARYNAELARVEAEEARAAAESERQTTFTKSQSDRETAYDNAEASRDSQYSDAEALRDSQYEYAETSRGLQYEYAEAQRQGDFNSNEDSRMSEEIVRISAETDRQNAEDQRVANENKRLEAENERLEAENARKTDYVKAEEDRNTWYKQAEAQRDRAYKQAEAKRDYKSTASAYDALDERVTNIESYINPKYYITAEERAFERVIPANACPFIELNSVGSVLTRSKNLLNPADFGRPLTEDGGIVPEPEVNEGINYSAFVIFPEFDYYTVSAIDQDGNSVPCSFDGIDGPNTIEAEAGVPVYVFNWDSGTTAIYVQVEKGDVATPFERYYPYAPVKRCDNLIPFPYLNKWSNPNDGINAIVDDNGVITVNGTYTGTAAVIDFNLAENMNLPIGKYTISGCTGTDKFRLFIWIKGGSTDRYITQYIGATSFDINDGEYIYRLNIRITKDTQINNLVVKPMINKGETALPYEPYYTGTKSTKVTAIEHYGANLVDDVKFFTDVGFIKQSNGYWLGSNKTATIFTNTEKRAGSLSIAYMSRTLTANGTGNSVALALINYTDGTSEYKALTTDGTTEYGRKTYTTKADKTVDKIRFSYGITGTFEIKDLIINWGGVVDYHPYSAEPIFTINIPQSIQNLNGYGFGKIDFDNKKYIQEFDENGELSTPIITDISSYLIDFDNTPEVQAAGTMRFLNEAKAPILSTISFLAKEGSV